MNGIAGCLLLVAACANIPDDDATRFLQQHCLRCHGAMQQEADRRFDTLSEIRNTEELQQWQDIVDQLNLQTMPPADEPQPAAAQRQRVIDVLTERIAAAQQTLQQTGRHSVLRRLNAWEYRQSIGDLLGLDVSVWNPAERFPQDVTVDGFDTNGAALVTSGMLLGHYFQAAESAIRRATQFGPSPETQTWEQKSPFYFEGQMAKKLPKLFHTGRFRYVPTTPYTELQGRHYRGGHLGFLPLFQAGGVPVSGRYTVRVKAAAAGRFHNYAKAVDDFRSGDPLVLELAAVDRRGSVISSGSVSRMVSLARTELTSDQPQWLQWDVDLQVGYEPEIRFRNGPIASKRLVRMLATHAADRPEFAPYIDLPDKKKRANGILSAYQGPRLQIWEIRVTGPHPQTWPPVGHRALYGGLQENQLTTEMVAERLDAFATAAFRRPPLAAELAPIQRLVQAKLQEGVRPLDALQLGFQAILCSPGFLYLNLGEGELSDFALASRLSYFLWSSPPDERLLTLAAAGRLKSQLPAEVDRLLADPRSDRFVTHFVRRWLDLDNIGTMPPAADFLAYYRDNLQTAMREEAETFFRHVLDANLPPAEFLTANYSFLNRELAEHYGVAGVTGNTLQQVTFADNRRGGLLGQGAFLTASANGVDTSPVVRGVYVLEKLLGYTPPPPPPDVPAIEPDIRGAKTIREQLVKHREVASCASCHRKIDPPGFALENFDAIGGWREAYGPGQPVDPSGMLSEDQRFASVAEFRQLLAGRQDEFQRCLAEKLMTCALGRQLEIGDRPSLDAILKDQRATGGGLRDLIRRIVLSESFQTN